MPSLSIKNVPEAVVDKLRKRARRHHRSMQGELLAIIEDATRDEVWSIAEVVAEVQRLGLNDPDESAALVRAARDER